jgi:flagellin
MAISRINTNLSAITARDNITKVGSNLTKSIERLSSGLRINRASDDAAGLSVANRLRTQTQGLDVAVANAQDGINLINVAEGALEETTNRLNRIRQLSLQAANTGVNDFQARSAIQDEVFQNIDEITRIANTTLFGSNYLLNGDFSIKTNMKAGQQDYGINVDASPVASSLETGTAFLNVKQIKQGFNQIVAGEAPGQQQILSTGIRNQSDIAVSTAYFGQAELFGNGAFSAGGTTLATNFFNGISVYSGDVFSFNGVLADGVTQFNGSLSLASGTDMDDLVSAVNEAIDAAELALFGVATANSVPTAYRTAAALGTGSNGGRLVLSSSGDYINQSNLNMTLIRSGNIATSSYGVVRSENFGKESAISGSGQVGNSITAITGSTFMTGEFSIQISDVQNAQQRKMESVIAFRDGNGSIVSRTASLNPANTSTSIVLNGTFVDGNYTGGVSLTNGDTITLTGFNADGTTFQGVFTFDPTAGADETNLSDFEFSTVSGLIRELNYRTRAYDTGAGISTTLLGTQTRFEDAIFTFTASGTLQLIDDLARSDSEMSFTLTFENGATSVVDFTYQDDAVLTQEGYAEQATFRIDGGDAVRAESGDVITLKGVESTVEGVPTSQFTFRVGSDLTEGTDQLEAQSTLFAGRLNGGASVTFTAGEQDVIFYTPGTTRDPSKFLTIDFDSIVNVTSSGTSDDIGVTVVLSTTNTALNFQIGAFAGQSIKFSLGDLKADNLGFGRGSGSTVQDINLTTLSGANKAVDIVDAALDQVNRTRSILGAATNRLESTVANLSVASENLTASESRIRDADFAAETSQFTLNQILLQAGTSVLAQSNFQSQGFLSLLG